MFKGGLTAAGLFPKELEATYDQLDYLIAETLQAAQGTLPSPEESEGKTAHWALAEVSYRLQKLAEK